MAVLGALGDLVLALSADTGKFESDLGKANRLAEKFGQEVGRSLTRLAGAIAALGGATGFGALVKSQIDAADAAGKMAQKIGISTEALSAYMVAAKLSDVSNEQLKVGFQQLSKNQADFVRGTGEAADGFLALGITVDQVKAANGDTAKIFDLVAGKLAQFEDGANKTAIAMKLLGRSGADLIPLVNSLEETKGKAAELGAIIDKDTAKAAEKFNDTMTEVSISIQAMGLVIAKDLLPILQSVSTALADAARGAQQFSLVGAIVKTVFETIVVLGAEVLFIIEAISKALVVAGARLRALATLDFKGSKILGEEFAKEMEEKRKKLDEFTQSVLGLKAAASGMPSLDEWRFPKPSAPGTRDSKADQSRAQKDAEFLARQLQESLEEEQRIQMEAWHWTAFYADKKLQEEKDLQAARLQAIVDSYAREQELAIEHGEILSSGPSASMRLEELRQSLLTEEEMEIEAFNKKMVRLEEEIGGLLDVEKDGMTYREQLEMEHQQRLLEIRRKSLRDLNSFTKAGYVQQAQTIFGELASITSGVAQHDKKLFELNKIAATANAIINTYQGVTRTLATYPWPAAGVLAAVHLAAGLAQVRAIQGTTFGTGSIAPSIVGTTAATPVSPVEQERQRSNQTTIVNLPGEDFISTKTVRKLLKEIEDSTRGGGRVVVA